MLMIRLSFACTGIKSPLGEAGKSRQLLSARIISKLVIVLVDTTAAPALYIVGQ